MKHRVERIVPTEAPPSSGHYLSDLPPTKRGMALGLLERHRRDYGETDCIRRIVAALELDAETDADDFLVAAQWRDKALSRLLDADAMTALKALSLAWSASPEQILSLAITSWGDVRPDPDLLDDGAISI